MTNRVISDTSNVTIKASPPSEVATIQATSNSGEIGFDVGTAKENQVGWYGYIIAT